MSQAINRYKADLRELSFVLFEQFRVQELSGRAPYSEMGEAETREILKSTYKFATDVLGPLNPVGDRVGCRVENGRVITAPGFKEAWTLLHEQGIKLLGLPTEYGGLNAPQSVVVAVEELLSGANTAFNMYPGLAYGAAELIGMCGTDAQKARYLQKIFSGTWGGTMCLTESQAGSDVGMAKSRAARNADGTFNITGTKIYISSGDQDFTENVVHLVLARIDGAPPGTKGLSLFIVPRLRVNDDGSVGEDNDVAVASIEHKMGINGSSTCVLSFGENGRCQGELVGGVENLGMPQMFKMMNGARIGVGLQGVALASTAYLNALDYAKDRKQGASITRWKDPTAPRASIIEHADVRRMLLEMKAKVEGSRALLVKLAQHDDWSKVLHGVDDEKAAYHHGQVELLTPLVKAYSSDQAFRVCEMAIQTFGGAGYTKDYPVEQYCRDSKIFSIYEGTNHIQAMDLVGRKLGQNGGMHTQQLQQDISEFVVANLAHPTLGDSVKILGEALEALGGSVMRLLGWFQGGQIQMVPLVANRFLELMSEVVVAWLLLDAARIAEEKLADVAEGHPDRAFYTGKRYAAVFYAKNILPGAIHKAQVLSDADSSAIEIPDEAFASL